MSPFIHHAKETAERLSGMHLVFSRNFPFLHAERRFLTVRVDLHNRCNLRCRMCYFALDEVWNDRLVELSDAAIARLEREVWPRTRELWLSCSTEPLIGRKLGEVLPRAKAAGIPSIQLVTNGMALSEAKARMLVEGGLDRLSVSIDGATAATYEAIRTMSNFERVVGNVRRFQGIRAAAGSAAPALTVRAVMMTCNLGEWAGIVRLGAELGADRVILQPQTYYTEFGAKDPLWEHRDEVNAALGAAAEAARECGVALEAPAGFGEESADEGTTEKAGTTAGGERPACAGCLAPWLQLVVYPDGQVTPCYQLFGHGQFGNLERQSYAEIYYGAEFRRLREALRTGRFGAVCRECAAGKVEALGEDAAEKLQREIFPKS